VQLCIDLGHEVVEAAPTINADLLIPSYGALWAAGCAWSIDSFASLTGQSATPDKFELATWTLYEMGSEISASNYLLSLTLLQNISREISRFFDNYDVWLTPTLTEPPVPLGTFDSPVDNPLQGMYRAFQFVPFTIICNIAGQPAMSVPLFWNTNNLPVGSQFIGRFGDEATLFRLAAQLEEAKPWAERRPPCSLDTG
jgi:amidase